jgi:predicted acetyltransferase
MSKKSDILKIWQECFPQDSAQWKQMFFNSAYDENEALTVTDDHDITVSSLLLRSYTMTFHEHRVGMAYIYGAGTLRQHRAKGHMARLVTEAVKAAAARGDMLITLIPAADSLRQYYSRFGFSTVFFSRPLRYTSVHNFSYEGDFTSLTDPEAVYTHFDRLMSARPCCVQHTRQQLQVVQEDARLSHNPFAAMVSADGAEVAMAWGTVSSSGSNEVRVTEILADSTNAANAALSALQLQVPDSSITILEPATDDAVSGNFEPHGMARIVRPDQALALIARSNPKLKLTLHLTDPIMPENTGTYSLLNGSIDFTPGADAANADLMLTPDVLTSLLFSSAPIAEVTGLPAMRPQMSLMLD